MAPRIVSSEMHVSGRASVTLSGDLLLSGRSQIPPLLIAGIVTPYGNVPGDGDLVVSVEPAWIAIQEALHKDPSLLLRLDPRQWEELVAASYDRAGYDEVVLTPRSGDHGRDVIAVKKGWGSIRIVDQVKAYSPGRHVTANDVRALVGVTLADHRASKGIVTTTTNFAPRIHEDPLLGPLIPFRLELVNGAQLFDRLKNLK